MPTVSGNNSSNTWLNLGNNYTVYGRGGNDILTGGIMYGGPGDDTYYVDSTKDRIIESSGQGSYDQVWSAITSYTLPSHVEALSLLPESNVYRPSQARNGIGNGLNNFIVGNEFNNRLEGKGGNDTLVGDRGNDTLLGGAGHDVLVGFGVSYNGEGTVILGSGERDVLVGGDGRDQYVLQARLNGKLKVAYLSKGEIETDLGLDDYALIRGFNAAQDQISLAGGINDYVFEASPISAGSGAADTAIYYLRNGYSRDLIGIIQDFSASQLTANSLVFEQYT